MDYISTRGQAAPLNFEDVTLAGLASDGGLYVPREWPSFSMDELRAMQGLSYVDLATRVMKPFVGNSLDDAELRDLCEVAYGRFAHRAVTPLVQLDERNWILELFHGPTLAFKDVALQLLGLLFERFLSRRDTNITIVGATSGDTGSAAIDAVANKAKVEIYMLHPRGRVSEVQRRQMTTMLAPNVYNIAIDGSFDDAQAMVKRMFADTSVTDRFQISAVNSINWARLMAQVVYYFWAALRLGGPERPVAFSVPTGNFGDVFAGYVAAKMGLPIAKLIVATNVNDILHRALSAGDYSVGSVTPTAAPSMDIQVSSNFERLLFDLEGRDGDKTRARMQAFEASKTMALSADMRAGAGLFRSCRADPADMAAAMVRAWEGSSCILDPHTAIGFHGALQATDLPADVPVVTLATAHPAKFPDAVQATIGEHPVLPTRIGDLFDREERFDVLPGTYEAVRDYVVARAKPAHG